MKLGFIGLGQMGSRLASRLLGAGHAVVGFDPDVDALAAFEKAGGTAASSVVDLRDRADTVLLSLPAPDIVKSVVLSDDGLAGGSAVKTIIDLSTIGPTVSAEIGEALESRAIAFIDAPVSGGTSGASTGNLAVMVAGCPDVLTRVSEVLQRFGKVFHVGHQPGQGQVMKLLNNYLSATALAATSEACVFGVKAGLDAQTIVDVVNSSSGRSSASQDKFPRSVLTGTFDFGFALGLICKDLQLYSDYVSKLQAPFRLGQGTLEVWLETLEKLGGGEDFTSVIRPMEEAAGVVVRASRSAADPRA